MGEALVDQVSGKPTEPLQKVRRRSLNDKEVGLQFENILTWKDHSSL